VDFQPGAFKLYAYNAENGHRLFAGDAGVWPFPDNNATVMPVAANGKVFVASYKTLSIFGLGKGAPAALPHPAAPDMRAKLAPGQHEIYGTIRGINGDTLTVQKRDGSMLTVDASGAAEKYARAEPKIGKALVARGSFSLSAVLMADTVLHAKSSPAMWHPDR
jgi:hypothetical protein